MKKPTRFSLIVSLALCFVCLLSVNGGSKSAYWRTDDYWRTNDSHSHKLFYKATNRFKDTLSESQFESFYNSANSLKSGGGTTKADRTAASELVYQYARASDTRSAVEVSTSKGTGAKIKYQTLGQRMRHETPTTAKQLTALTERMLIGRYYIWSEREDHVTSDEDSEFEIANPVEKVMLLEKASVQETK